MALSSKQQKPWRYMVNSAWRTYCDRECITDSTKASKEEWYRNQLDECLGVRSSDDVDPRDGFETAMAWFEKIADDGSFYWQKQAQEGDAKRKRHLLKQTIKTLRLKDEYIAAIEDRMGIRRPFRDYTAEEANNLRIALLTHVGRQQDRVIKQGVGQSYTPSMPQPAKAFSSLNYEN